MSEALLPCPFCCHPPEFTSERRNSSDGDTRLVFLIRCHNCPVGPGIAMSGPSGYGRSEWRGEHESNEAARAAAIEAWNTRAE